MKTTYYKPKTQIIPVYNESLMLTASPGAGGKYNPDDPIDSKENNLFCDEEDEENDSQSTPDVVWNYSWE